MRVIPAVDLRERACVQLVGGAFEREAVRVADPLQAAERWRAAGFTQLHVVDLDAAVSGDRRTNGDIVARLVADSGMETQAGGGVRDSVAIDTLLGFGAARVVVATRAWEDTDWLARETSRWPGRVIVALDVADGRPVVRGWRAAAPLSLDDALSAIEGLPLAGVLVTCVDVEGRMAGPDLSLFDRVIARTTLPVIASGGVGDVRHLRQLRDRRVSAVVVGMALYTGALDARATAEEFQS